MSGDLLDGDHLVHTTPIILRRQPVVRQHILSEEEVLLVGIRIYPRQLDLPQIGVRHERRVEFVRIGPSRWDLRQLITRGRLYPCVIFDRQIICAEPLKKHWTTFEAEDDVLSIRAVFTGGERDCYPIVSLAAKLDVTRARIMPLLAVDRADLAAVRSHRHDDKVGAIIVRYQGHVP